MATIRREAAFRSGLANWNRSNPLVRIALGAIPIVILLGLYTLLVNDRQRPRVYPPLDSIWYSIGQIAIGNGEFASAYVQIGYTSVRILAAFGFAFVAGIFIGVVAGRNKLVFSFVENLVWIFMAVPSAVWVFLFAVALGLNPAVPILAIAALVTPQFIVLVSEGAKSVPHDLVEMARSYKVPLGQRITGLFLPFLVPYIIAASRTAFATTVQVMLVAEVIGEPNGIGFEVEHWEGQLQMAPILAWGITMIVLGLLVDNLIFGPIERRITGWKGKPVESGLAVEAGLGGSI